MSRCILSACLALPAALFLAACETQPVERSPAERPPREVERLHSERGGIGAVPTPDRTSAMAGVSINPRRSLFVTETAILSQFSFKAVMDQLVAQSGVPGLTSLQLFRQLWDTQNPKPGLGLGEHCNDVVDGANRPIFNTYPYACRPSEGIQAQRDPFSNPGSSDFYSPIGLAMRFDLAPADGSDCGEYRIVFAKNPSGGRNLVIFESVLPNPTPALGLDGCLPVAEFWEALSTNNSVPDRATKLRDFYFNGLPGFMPVIHIDNYGAASGRATGQLRTNQFMGGNWLLREFRLTRACVGASCSLKATLATDKVNPFGGLFSPGSTHPATADFRDLLASPAVVAGLAVNDINAFNYTVPDRFNGGQSDQQAIENLYTAQFGNGGTVKPRMQTQLTNLGSTLTPENLVARAQALSCAGCHQLSNGANLGGGLQWPSSLGFVHVAESTENGPEGQRFQISPALTNVFLPHRKAILEEFLNRPRGCAHSTCVMGGPLPATCHPCAATVCEIDSACCTDNWDSICVEEAEAWCNLCN